MNCEIVENNNPDTRNIRATQAHSSNNNIESEENSEKDYTYEKSLTKKNKTLLSKLKDKLVEKKQALDQLTRDDDEIESNGCCHVQFSPERSVVVGVSDTCLTLKTDTSLLYQQQLDLLLLLQRLILQCFRCTL